MSTKVFSVLFLCMLLSVALLGISNIMDAVPGVTIVSGCLPLFYYHYYFLRPRAKSGLTPAAIDSVYYFGFLITLFALGLSAVAIARGGKDLDVKPIIFQFGVGLFATGYAVIARMHLTSLTVVLEEGSSEVVMDRQMQRSIELLNNMEALVHRTSQFSNTMASTMSDVVSRTQTEAQASMLAVAAAFDEQMKESMRNSNAAAQSLIELLKDPDWAALRIETSKALTANTLATHRLNSAIGSYAERTIEAAAATKAMTDSSISSLVAMKDLNAMFVEMGSTEGGLARAVQALTAAEQAVGAGVASIVESVRDISQITGSVSQTLPTFRKMQTVAKKTYEQLEALEGITLRFDRALSQIAQASESSHSLSDHMTQLSKLMPPLCASTASIMAVLDNGVGWSNKMDELIGRLPEQAESIHETSNQLATELQKILDYFKQTALESQNLGLLIASASRTISESEKVLIDGGAFPSAVSRVSSQIGDLGSAIERTQADLSGVSNSIKNSVADMAKSLEDDVRRSSAAANLLTDRLAQVAQLIIDSTKKHQGMST